jgi:sarcosine oxidase
VVAHLNAALASGAEIHGHERLIDWDTSGGAVRVTTDRSRYEAGALVLTVGPWTPGVDPELRRHIVAERQVLLWAQPRRPEHFEMARFPIFNMETPEGRFYGFPVHSVPGFKIGKYHHRCESVEADSVDRASASSMLPLAASCAWTEWLDASVARRAIAESAARHCLTRINCLLGWHR